MRGYEKRLATDLRHVLTETGTTAMMVTHDHVAAARAHRLLRISDGRLLEEHAETRDEALALAFPDAKIRGN